MLVSGEITRSKETVGEPLDDAARFRVFFERSADAMSLLDPQTLRYMEANEAVVKLLGAPNREALRNASPTERFPERQPDGRLSIEKARALIEIVLDQGSLRFEWLVRRFDGTELPLDIVATAVPFDGRTLLSLVYREVSTQKRAESEIRQLNASLQKRVAERTIKLARSEEKFRALFEGTRQAVFLYDENGILEANQSWLRLLGYSSLNEVVGKRPVELAAPIQPVRRARRGIGKKAPYRRTGSRQFAIRMAGITPRRDQGTDGSVSYTHPAGRPAALSSVLQRYHRAQERRGRIARERGASARE